MAVKKTTSKSGSRATKIDFMKATNNIGKPISAVAGFAVGKYALKKLEKNETVSGLLGNDMKNYIVPAAVTMGGLIGTQFTKNQYIQLGLVGLAGAGVESIVKKATGKSILQGLEGILGDDDYTDYEDIQGLQALNPVTQALPAADIDIEREIQASMSGAANDFSMSDEPIGEAEYEEIESSEMGKIKDIDPDSMDYDVFAGDMMSS